MVPQSKRALSLSFVLRRSPRISIVHTHATSNFFTTKALLK